MFGAGKKIDQQTLDELEELLILADVGVDTSMKIMDALNAIIRRDRITDAGELYPALEEVLLGILQPSEAPLEIPSTTKPFVIMIVGVNGAGNIAVYIANFQPFFQSINGAGDKAGFARARRGHQVKPKHITTIKSMA